jgi:hypothetical protein
VRGVLFDREPVRRNGLFDTAFPNEFRVVGYYRKLGVEMTSVTREKSAHALNLYPDSNTFSHRDPALHEFYKDYFHKICT